MILRGGESELYQDTSTYHLFSNSKLCPPNHHPRWDESQPLTPPSPKPSNPNGGTILAFGAGTHVLLPVTLQELFVRHLSTIHWLPIRVCDISLQVNHHFLKIVVFVLWMMKKFYIYFRSFFLGRGAIHHLVCGFEWWWHSRDACTGTWTFFAFTPSIWWNLFHKNLLKTYCQAKKMACIFPY